jgi:hypothetical protein
VCSNETRVRKENFSICSLISTLNSLLLLVGGQIAISFSFLVEFPAKPFSPLLLLMISIKSYKLLLSDKSINPISPFHSFLLKRVNQSFKWHPREQQERSILTSFPKRQQHKLRVSPVFSSGKKRNSVSSFWQPFLQQSYARKKEKKSDINFEDLNSCCP